MPGDLKLKDAFSRRLGTIPAARSEAVPTVNSVHGHQAQLLMVWCLVLKQLCTPEELKQTRVCVVFVWRR